MKKLFTILSVLLLLNCGSKNIYISKNFISQDQNNVKLYFIIPDTLKTNETVNVVCALIKQNLIKGNDFLNAYQIEYNYIPKRTSFNQDSMTILTNQLLNDLNTDISKYKGNIVVIVFASFDDMNIRNKLNFLALINDRYHTGILDEFSLEGQFNKLNSKMTNIHKIIKKNSFKYSGLLL
jgi:hypothetical protein